jgi:hypothetical protein
MDKRWCLSLWGPKTDINAGFKDATLEAPSAPALPFF